MRKPNQDKRKMVKIRFELEPGAWHGSGTETLWATPVGPNQYRLENVPFFAFGVSWEDVVLAKQDGPHRVFVEVLLRGGHSTYRLLPVGTWTESFERYWAPLAAAGCAYEGGPARLRAVDVPPQADLHEVYKALRAGEATGVWDFEEGHCGKAVA